MRDAGWIKVAVSKGLSEIAIPRMDAMTDEYDRHGLVSDAVEYGRCDILREAIQRGWLDEIGQHVHDLGDGFARVIAHAACIKGNTRHRLETEQRHQDITAWEADLITCRSMLSAACPVIPDGWKMSFYHHYTGDDHEKPSWNRWDAGAIALNKASITLMAPQGLHNHAPNLVDVQHDRSWIDQMPGGREQTLRLMRRVWTDSQRQYGMGDFRMHRVLTATTIVADLMPEVESQSACNDFILNDVLPTMLPIAPEWTIMFAARARA